MKNLHFLVRLFWLLVLVFFVSRLGFMVYNSALWPSAADPSVTGFSGHTWLKDVVLTCFYGTARHDLIVVAALLAVPALAAACGVRRVRLWLTPYYVLMAVAVGVIIVADVVMYEFWQFKLGSVVLAYAAYPEGTANSVSPAFVATRLGTGIVLIGLIIWGCIWATPRRVEPAPLRERLLTALFTLLGMGVVASGTGLGSVYKSDRIFLNHAAVNPVLGFVSSFSIHDYKDRYDYFDETERANLMASLYEGNGAGSTTALTDTLLRTERPDVVVIFMESFGSEFVTSLGGAKGTTPDGRTVDVDACLERLIPEGVFWTNYYSNSFRTDRGTVSAFCGWPAYTDVGLMTHTEYHAALPSMPRSLKRAGYDTSYFYPGPTTNMGKGTFLSGIGFDHVLDDKILKPEEYDSPWGAHDRTSASIVARLLTDTTATAQPQLFCYQTVSSHESWDVPEERLQDKVQNAFAYTDAAVGMLIDSLKASPRWDNMLVIIIPDHGHLYNVTTPGSKALHHQAFDDPEFFHSPMLWLGGAIREPRRMDVLMNQSDLCATLLGQLGLDHSDYPWSRNVLSADYRHPFVYSVFPAGLLFRDATGTTLYDVSADRTIMYQNKGYAAHYGARAYTDRISLERQRRAQAILQTTYDGL